MEQHGVTVRSIRMLRGPNVHAYMPVIQLGCGVYQKRVQASGASTASAIAVDMCQDKALTNQMLRAVGVPVPDGRTVTSVEDVVDALGRRRTLMAVGPPGDRRDEDLCATIDATLSFAEEYLLYDLHDRRGREVNEVPELLQRRLPPDVASTVVPDQSAAIRHIWPRVQASDRLVLIVDEGDKALALIEGLTDDATCGLEVGAGGNGW